jgi:SP family galactose:H+ symporter-like MFS transporter
MQNANKNSTVIKVSIIAALAGLLFGLDVAYVNGALQLIVNEFQLNELQQGHIASYLLIGAAVGSLSSGYLSHKFGRKKLLVIAATVFTAGLLAGILTTDINMFLVVRFIIGLAVGVASFVAPLYISEIAPFKIRGALIAVYQLMITVGIFAMFVSNSLLSFTGSWRIMMAVLLFPASIMLIFSLFVPETPRWLVLKGRHEEAMTVLKKIRNSSEDIVAELQDIKSSHEVGKSKIAISTLTKIIVLGMFLQLLQQFSGINALMYYSTQMFATAGFENPTIATIVIGLVNMLTTLIAIRFVDIWGRKPILYLGLILLIISCSAVAYLMQSQASGLSSFEQYAMLGSCLLFIFAFAVSLGPIVWIICAEIFPLDYRDFGVTVTTMCNWIFNALIGEYTLIGFHYFGVSKVFLFFGISCFLGLFLVKYFTPETKNVSLEHLEENLKKGVALKDIGA